jgi:polysaccharide export outer membrane protein
MGVVVKRFVLLVLCLVLSAPIVRARPDPGPAQDSLGEIDWGRVPEYRIAPGDVLQFNFGPSDFLAGDVIRESVVRPDGRITLFPVGDVVAAGRTPAELQADLIRMLAVEYKEPRVTVGVKEMAGNLVYVLGQVKKPGRQTVGSFPTLLQAISDAGGFEDDAARNSVLILHRAGLNSVSVARVRADRLLRGAGDVALGRYDIIYVPRSAIGNLDVFVHQFFSQTVDVLHFYYVGWELFHLDRVFYLQRTSP